MTGIHQLMPTHIKIYAPHFFLKMVETGTQEKK